MPTLVPMAQDEVTELRISYRDDPESLNGDGIYAVGPNDARELLSALYANPRVPRERERSLPFFMMSTDGPSIMDIIKNNGYDLDTLVISVRKKGAVFEQEKKATPDDVSSLLERLKALSRKIESYDTAKGVAIFDEDTALDMVDSIKNIMETVKRLA